MQVSAIQPPPPSRPIAPIAPVAARKDNDGDNDNGAREKVKSANPPGVGSKLDISA